MKTFSDFIYEAEVKWNSGELPGSQKSPANTAKQKYTQLGKDLVNPRLSQQDKNEIAQRMKKMGLAIKGASEVASVNDPPTPSKDKNRAPNRGYASKPRDVISTSGTQSGIQRTDLPQEPGTVVGDRFGTRGRNKFMGRSGGSYGVQR